LNISQTKNLGIFRDFEIGDTRRKEIINLSKKRINKKYSNDKIIYHFIINFDIRNPDFEKHVFSLKDK